ncbi:hypothetical protein SLEP1_g56787 [Rubroshorea leprosula]|uniref:Uncharacterized protein n=1 Tax=Rubroshorea leprosula TaxID=152421 RepID=A0AAV5MJH3_9ROSI|nr:hypothetical protein SLEP1_g56787 [Rubroshorea leprosula]
MWVLVSRHGVAIVTHRHTRTGAQGGSRKTQRALPAEASIPGPWREVADRTRKLGRDAGSHGCDMARGTGTREHKHKRRRERVMRAVETFGALEQSRKFQSSLGGLDKAQNSDLDKDVNSTPDKLVYSTRQGVWDGLLGQAQPGVSPRAL